MQVVGERFAQGRQEGERASAEQQRRCDVASVCQGHDDLHGNGVEDGGSDVLLAGVLGNEVLDVCLAEHATTRRDGVDVCGVQRQGPQFVGSHVQQDSHLVDESSRTSGTVAVHAQVGGFALVEEDDLGIFTADVNQCRHFPMVAGDVVGRGDHLLYEGEAAPFGNTHPDRACQAERDLGIAQPGADVRQQGE